MEVTKNTARQALESLLSCPACRGGLSAARPEKYVCEDCGAEYPIVDGIPVFTGAKGHPSSGEIDVREQVSEEALRGERGLLLGKLRRAHYVTLMEEKAGAFLKRFDPEDVVLDVGAGWGWHWLNAKRSVVCVDFSLTTLLVAKRLLQDRQNVMLVCADATRLPFRNGVFDGLWSVQTYQHLEPGQFEAGRSEIHRTMRPGGYFEIRWLNDSLLLRLAYAVCLKKYHKVRTDGPFYTRRQNNKDLVSIFEHDGMFTGLRVSYDEALFHPILRLTHDIGALKRLDGLISSIPLLNGMVANQTVISGHKATTNRTQES